MKTKHLIAVPLAVAASMGVAPAAQADTLGDLGVVAEVEITSESELGSNQQNFQIVYNYGM